MTGTASHLRPAAASAVAVLCERIVALRAISPGLLLLALDGRSGAGKSTVARQAFDLVLDGT